MHSSEDVVIRVKLRIIRYALTAVPEILEGPDHFTPCLAYRARRGRPAGPAPTGPIPARPTNRAHSRYAYSHQTYSHRPTINSPEIFIPLWSPSLISLTVSVDVKHHVYLSRSSYANWAYSRCAYSHSTYCKATRDTYPSRPTDEY